MIKTFKNILSPNKVPGTLTYYSFSDLLFSLKNIIPGNFKKGYYTELFQQKFSEYLNKKESYCLPSARISLYYILKALNLPSDSEVLLTPITISDIVNSIISNKLTPKFIDIQDTYFNINIEDFKKKITPNSRILIITYLYGIVPENIEDIIKICRKKNIIIIEDISQSLGAVYKTKQIGNLGDYSICSLSSFKTCSTLFGGVISSNDSKTLEIVKKISDNELIKPSRIIFFKMLIKIFFHKLLMSRLIFSYFTFFLIQLIHSFNPRLYYLAQTGNISILSKCNEKKFPHKSLLFHYTDFQSILGLKMLYKINEFNKKLNSISMSYINLIEKKCFSKKISNVFWRFPLKIKNLRKIKKTLFLNNIEPALDSLPVCSDIKKFKKYGLCNSASKIIKNTILLPIHPDLTKKQINNIINFLNKKTFQL